MMERLQLKLKESSISFKRKKSKQEIVTRKTGRKEKERSGIEKSQEKSHVARGKNRREYETSAAKETFICR